MARIVVLCSLVTAVLGCRQGPPPDAGGDPQPRYVYWQEAGRTCPRGDLLGAAQPVIDSAVACAGEHAFVETTDEAHWLLDMQMLIRCENENIPSSCHIGTWGVARPFTELGRVADTDFDIAGVLVARIAVGRDHPQGAPAGVKLRGPGWINYLFLRRSGGATWQAFVLRVRDGGPSGPPMPAVVELRANELAHKAAVPPGAIRWQPSRGYSAFGADTTGSERRAVEDELWTRCGTGCCTVGFR